jgi:hypothetical protein
MLLDIRLTGRLWDWLPQRGSSLAIIRRKIEAPERLFLGIGPFRRPPQRSVRPKTVAV